MSSAKKNKAIHIDDLQPETVEKHFRYLVESEEAIDSEISEFTTNDLPEWFDEDLFKQGQDYYKNNMLSLSLAGLMGLLSVLAIPSILKVLIFTKQSGTPCTAFKRYLETTIHMHKLYTLDVTDKTSEWWKSLNTIRWKHATNSRRSKENQSAPITHRDMALTQFGFIGYALLSAKKLNLTNKIQEREALNHFWRVLGHVLGISDKINICRKNQEETTQLCRLLLQEVYVKHMKENYSDFLHMADAFIDGLWSIDFTLDNQAFVYLWYELSGLKYTKPLTWSSWLNMQYRSFILYSFGIPYIGYCVRKGFNYYLNVNYWIAQRYPIVAWIRFGKSKTKINLYPKLFNK